MAESITQSDKDYSEESVATIEVIDGEEQETKTMPDVPPVHISPPVIWTPRFIVLFFLTLVTGLSLESVLTQGWLNGFYKAEWVLLTHVALILACLLVLVGRARAWWMRMGAIFGCIWAIFTGANFVASLLSVDARSGILVQLYAAMSSALLGAYICFSTNRVPFRRWDNWFFGLAPLLGGCAIILLYLPSLSEGYPFRILTSVTTTVILYLCVLIWWLRPSCWKSQPCSTFLFGLATIIMLLLPSIRVSDIAASFFFSQVELLCLLLGVMRALQGEIRVSKSAY